MQCPTDETLVAYKAGRLTPEVERDLERHTLGCASCRAVLVEWMRATQDAPSSKVGESGPDQVPTPVLTEVLVSKTDNARHAAMDCPDEYTISRFVEGKLSGKKKEAISAHLERCPDCRFLVGCATSDGGVSLELDGDGEARPEKKSVAWRRRFERGARIGRYIVIEPVGQGAMGVVYSAYDPELDRKVALKVLRTDVVLGLAADDASARLLREAQAMARVGHPNVVSIHDVVKVGDDVVIAMEFIDGVNLVGWLRQQTRSWRDVLDVFIRAGRGLEASHKAGLVHRDFKPANVLISKTGRVCVSDFGLAKGLAFDVDEEPEDELSEPAKCSPSLLASSLTHTDIVVGTPGYMAPEQFERRVSDARSDQFAFSVALYEALYGSRPFTGKNLIERRKQILNGEVPLPRSRRDVPSWVREIVVRGLHPKAENRFATMSGLLARLSRDQTLTRRRRWSQLGVAALVIGVVATTYLATRKGSSLCQGAGEAFAGVWDAPVKDGVRQAFHATGKSYAADTFARVEKHLDAWTQQWVTHHTEACEATHFAGHQSKEVLDLRMACLRRKAGGLKVLVAVFTNKPDASVLDKAVEASLGLGPIAFCADVEALKQTVLPPENPQIRLAVDELRNRFEEAQQRIELGKYKESAAILTEVGPEAEALSYAPLQTEFELLKGRTFVKLGQYPQAEVALNKAMRLGLQFNQRDQALRAAQELAHAVGRRLGRPKEGLNYAQVALGLSAGLKGEREARSRSNLGLVFHAQGRYQEAEAEHRRALALWVRAMGPEHPDVARSHNNIGIALHHQGKFAEAEAELRRSIGLKEKALGAEHPDVARSRNNLGNVLDLQGKYAQAEAAYRSAIALKEKALGVEHPDIARSRNNLGTVLRLQGRYAEAEAEHRHALLLWERLFGPKHSKVSWPLAGLGNACWSSQKYTEANKHFSRAFSICGKKPCDTATESQAEFGMARVVWKKGHDKTRALELAKKARAGFVKVNKKREITEVEIWLKARGVKLDPIAARGD